MRRKVEKIGKATLIFGDAREELQAIKAQALITDPVWPNVPQCFDIIGRKIKLHGADDPDAMFKAIMKVVPRTVARLVIHMGCNSDPRFLRFVPKRYEFLRTCWLEYIVPTPVNRILYTSDVAYAYGTTIKFQLGRQILPGRCEKQQSHAKNEVHPCVRNLGFVRWLVNWFSDANETVVDPFMGSGTTLIAAESLGRASVGIEINRKFFDEACRRVEAETRVVTLFSAAELDQTNQVRMEFDGD